jgi:hypothetical protein
MQDTTNIGLTNHLQPSIWLCPNYGQLLRGEKRNYPSDRKCCYATAPLCFLPASAAPSPLVLLATYRNNGSVNEMNAKYIFATLQPQFFLPSYICVIRSHLAFILFSSFPYIVWLNLRLQWWFYVPSLFSLCFSLYINSLLFRERQKPHYNPRSGKKISRGRFLTIYIYIYIYIYIHVQSA